MPASRSLPLREAPHQGALVIAYLENLLPDNQAIRERVAVRVRAGGTDAWHMLERIGRNCVGALQFVSGDVPEVGKLEGERPTATSWRADETYIKVNGHWTYLYCAVDRDGQALDTVLSERRNLAAARRFFKRAIAANGTLERVVIDKRGANLAGLQAANVILKFTGGGHVIEIRQVKYLNNILEQDHRFINRITRPMMGFKAVHSAAATIAGIETAHMIRIGQIPSNGAHAFRVFAALAG